MSGPRQHYASDGPRTRALFLFDADGTLFRPDGVQGRNIRVETGQVAAFARASAADGVDSAGGSYSVPAQRPAWSQAVGRPETGLPIRPADSPRAVETLSAPFLPPIAAHSGYVRFTDRGWAATVNARALVWGDASSTSTPRVRLYRTGSAVTVAVLSGSDVLQTGASVPGGAIIPADLVEVWWSLVAGATLEVSVSINGAPEVFAPGSTVPAMSLPFAASAPELHLGGRAAQNVGGMELHRAVIWPDPDATMEDLRHVR